MRELGLTPRLSTSSSTDNAVSTQSRCVRNGAALIQLRSCSTSRNPPPRTSFSARSAKSGTSGASHADRPARFHPLTVRLQELLARQHDAPHSLSRCQRCNGIPPLRVGRNTPDPGGHVGPEGV